MNVKLARLPFALGCGGPRCIDDPYRFSQLETIGTVR
jgi:hypothetical protein